MTHNWKPGDVATIVLDGTLYIAVRGHTAWRDRWFIGGPARGSQHGWTDDQLNDSARPLLVIDPEDRAQVERLSDALGSDNWYGTVGYLQATLRALLEPEPEEPTRFLAVVRDAHDLRWVRTFSVPMPPACQAWANGNMRAAWSDLPRPITVLSEGWQESTDD